MKKLLLTILIVVISVCTLNAAIKTTTGHGNWGTAGTWNPSGVPTASDSVVILAGHTVTLNVNGTCGAISVLGTLSYSGNNIILTVTNAGGLSGDVNINGALNFQNGNNQKISVYGSFYCSGTLTNNSGGNGSSIEFYGSGEKYIYCTSDIRFLLLNNATLNLNAQSNLTVTNGITLTNGKLNTGNYTLTLPTTATLTATNGRIEGTVIKNITTGTTGIVRLMSANNYINIQSTPVPTITSITIKSYPNTQPPDVRPEYDPELGVKRYYEITNVTGSGNVSLRLDYLSPEMGSMFVPANGNIWQYTGSGPWVDQGGINQAQYYVEIPVPLSSDNLIGKYAIADAGSAMPVQLAIFVGYFASSNSVTLEWETVSEINNYGFYVQKLDEYSKNYVTIEESFQPGAGNSLVPQKYSWTDENVSSDRIEYRLLQIDNDGLEYYSQPIVIMMNPSSTGDDEALPTIFKLNPNYPNPFNPSTKISFTLSKDGYTTLKIYNLIGEEVATLFSGMANAGKLYVVDFDGTNLPSGIYFSRLQSGSDIQTGKLILTK